MSVDDSCEFNLENFNWVFDDDEEKNNNQERSFIWKKPPKRKQFSFANKQDSCCSDDSYYPNCDVNVWLRSCTHEITDPITGAVRGHIPRWLSGALIRNGPGSVKAGVDNFSHLFDCSALLHRFEIHDGKVTYQCRFVQSDSYKKNWAANRIINTEFGTRAVPDPCQTIFQKVATVFDPKSLMSDNSMISVYPFGDQLYAFSEMPSIHRINPVTLETEEKVDVDDYVSIVNHTSHPHVVNDGTVYNLGMSMHLTGPRLNIVCFPNPGNNTNVTNKTESENPMFRDAYIATSIPSRWSLHPSYMHTFGITDKYFIIVEQPMSLSITGLLYSKLENEPLAGSMRWFDDELTQINLINRQSGNLDFKFYTEAFFYLHIINQYEDSGHLVLDICIYKDPSMINCLYIETMKAMHQNPDYARMFRSRPARFVMPLNASSKGRPRSVDDNENDDVTGKVNLVALPGIKAEAYYLESSDEIFLKPEKLCNLGCETPRINYERCLGKFYQYFYAISADVDADNPGTIIKVDVITKRVLTWCEENCYPSEPVFVQSPDASSEDDGVILSAIVWGGDDTNHVGLLILDARTFQEIGRAEFRTPSPVPKCLHGWFVPG